jgi:hypothetical protein
MAHIFNLVLGSFYRILLGTCTFPTETNRWRKMGRRGGSQLRRKVASPNKYGRCTLDLETEEEGITHS